MTGTDKMLSDRKLWKRIATLAAERKSKLQSFGENACGVLAKTREGFFVVDPEDLYVSSALLRNGEYNALECGLAKSFVSKKSDVLVVGAHIGAHAIALSRHCRRLTAVEANPDTFALFEANIGLNRCTNIKAINIAAAEKKRKIQFIINRANSGGSKRGPLKKAVAAYVYDKPQTITVNAASLDVLLGAKPFDFILMDIEGSEYYALKGMSRILSKAKVLSVEFIPHLLRYAVGISPQKFLGVIQPYFDWLYIPESGSIVSKEKMMAKLDEMYRADESHDGLYFLKNPLPRKLLRGIAG